jgi:hypothetical protein
MGKLAKLRAQLTKILLPIGEFRRKEAFVFYSMLSFVLILFFIRFLIAPNPFFCRFKGENYSLLWRSSPPDRSPLKAELLATGNEWKKIQYDFALWPLFVYDPYQNNQLDAWKKPLYRFEWIVLVVGNLRTGKRCVFQLFIRVKKIIWWLQTGSPCLLGPQASGTSSAQVCRCPSVAYRRVFE